MLSVVISGANGRMGRTLTALLAETADARLVGAAESPNCNYIGSDVGELSGLSLIHI